jgi:hypothetical protein
MIEPKVTLATVTALVTCGVMWLLGHFAYPHDIPAAAQLAVQTLVPAACTLLAGYLAPHKQRA